MNCVLHFLEKHDDINTLENNYDILKPIISDHFLMSFVPNAIPNRSIDQLFYKKINFIDDHHQEYSKYFFLYQINKYLQCKKYKRLLFISTATKLKQSNGLLDLMNQINCFDVDIVRFVLNEQTHKDMFMSRIWYLDTNLDYANCTYEDYCVRQKYDNFEVYLNSPFQKVYKLEEFV